MQALKSFLVAVVLSVLLAACGDGSNQNIVRAASGVVAILVERPDAPTGGKGNGLGTGFFIGENLIVTNNHVVENAKTIKVGSPTTVEGFEAEVIYTDPIADFALIRIKDIDAFARENDYQILKFADPHDLVLTEEVYTIGHPWGLFWSISKGILSAVDKKVDTSPKFMIQSDAHMYEGNSGGPLLNNEGEVLGVNSIMISQTGGSYGFALPVEMIEKVMRDFDRYKGQVKWAFLGVKILGNTVKEVIPDSAAAKGGLKPEDKILSIKTSNGTYDPIERELPIIMALHDPEVPVELTIQRGKDTTTLKFLPGSESSGELQKQLAKP